MEITLTINKDDVMQQIAVTTAYTGAKMMTADNTALHRISTVDEDEEHLERFWEESRSDICQELAGLVSFEGMVNGIDEPINPEDPVVGGIPPAILQKAHYELRLNVSKSFDEALLPSMKISLLSYFVHSMTARWFVYTNKEEAGNYANIATSLLEDIHRKALHKKEPERPTYKD